MAKNRDLKELDIVSNELEQLKKQSESYTKEDEIRDKKKKKTIIVACVLVAVLVLTFVVAVIFVENQSPVSFGPNEVAEQMTEEKIAEHEKRLEKLDLNSGTRKDLNYTGYRAYFDDKGQLIVDGYFRNFTGHEVYDIRGNIIVTNKNKDIIGTAYFEFPEKEFGSLKNGYSRPWQLIFENDYVNVEIIDLSKFIITTELEYFHK